MITPETAWVHCRSSVRGTEFGKTSIVTLACGGALARENAATRPDDAMEAEKEFW